MVRQIVKLILFIPVYFCLLLHQVLLNTGFLRREESNLKYLVHHHVLSFRGCPWRWHRRFGGSMRSLSRHKWTIQTSLSAWECSRLQVFLVPPLWWKIDRCCSGPARCLLWVQRPDLSFSEIAPPNRYQRRRRDFWYLICRWDHTPIVSMAKEKIQTQC